MSSKWEDTKEHVEAEVRFPLDTPAGIQPIEEFLKFAERQRSLIRIGQDLTGICNRQSLLRRARSYLINELSYDGAIILSNDEPEPAPQSHGNGASANGVRCLHLPVRLATQVLGRIEIPLNGHSLSDLELEVLKTFSDFVAVALKNIQRLDHVRAPLPSFDPVTGAGNRRKPIEAITRQALTGQSTGLIVFDIDRLQGINAAFGQPAVDALVQTVAKQAERCVRKTDILARFRGDEFAILLPCTKAQPLEDIAERVRSNVENAAVQWQGEDIRSTVSIGFACIDGEVDLNNLAAQANEALVAAKHDGRYFQRRSRAGA